MKTIIEMAREAGIIHPEMVDKTLERFAALIRVDERERFLQAVEEMRPAQNNPLLQNKPPEFWIRSFKQTLAQLEQKPKICEARQQCLRGLPCMCVAPAPRPVAWGVDWGRAGEAPCVSITKRLPDGGIEVLAVEHGPPRKWVGLTRDEQGFVYDSLHNATSRKDSFWVDFATAIEDKLKEKNT